MIVICGQLGSGSSASASLQSCLASRLRALLPLPGLTLYRLIWREKVTPSGRRICALRGSGLRTSGNAYTGWPTPDCQNGRDVNVQRVEAKGNHAMSLHHMAARAGWPPPNIFLNTGIPEQSVPSEDSGPMLPGSHVPMGKHVQLNPDFSRWLLGLPVEWDVCSPTETPSALRRRKSS